MIPTTYDILKTLRKAEVLGIPVTDGTVVDLIADHFPDATLSGIRIALRNARLQSRFPRACYP